MDKNQSSKIEEIKPTLKAQDFDIMWHQVYNELCYKVFYNTKDGKQLLAHMENKYFRRPVAIPGREPSWAYFNDGFNECIRSFSLGMQSYVNTSNAKPAQAKPSIKPSLPQNYRD